MPKKRILFVCLGNICRSPTAEAVLKDRINKLNLTSDFFVDSAGTADYHVGESSDHRSITHAKKRGYVMDHKARQLVKDDFSKFDLLICMDDQNYKNTLMLAPNEESKSKIKKMASYLKKFNDTFILDPWPLGPEAFEKVIDLLEDGCDNLIADLCKA